jgi:oxygen-independent coproporphyrinogen-3 oxidase
MVSDRLRKKISRYFTGENEIIFSNIIPSCDSLANKFAGINELGIYLHITFCNRICPYCPYNKELFTETRCSDYVNAVIKEVDLYAPFLKDKPVTSFYIGGGTPTTMLGKGIDKIINHLYRHLNMICAVHMESHPNHLTDDNLRLIRSLGVRYLSVGVEALQERHLKAIERPYTVEEVKKNVERAVSANFDCVNIDLIFDLPGQTREEIEQAGNDIVKLGVHQVATYPLFRFNYTRLGKNFQKERSAFTTMLRRRSFLKSLEDIFYAAGYKRSSVWAFTKNGVDKYCSVTVPVYLGLGASGSTYLKDIFYMNTFKSDEYIKAVNDGRFPIALSVSLTTEMQMAGWLYWRIYETGFSKSAFSRRFNETFDDKYGSLMKAFSMMGYLKTGNDQITLTDKGSYWIHAFEDFFSISFINKLWGTSAQNPWPEKVLL